ncbi:hypothetical protein DFJ73DRAFT_852432 [Zopfochytrium polystomum]|nr:hypothetical protein DFJ73DRAFT_852432 [Zopfochytrium polystomum]
MPPSPTSPPSLRVFLPFIAHAVLEAVASILSLVDVAALAAGSPTAPPLGFIPTGLLGHPLSVPPDALVAAQMAGIVLAFGAVLFHFGLAALTLHRLLDPVSAPNPSSPAGFSSSSTSSPRFLMPVLGISADWFLSPSMFLKDGVPVDAATAAGIKRTATGILTFAIHFIMGVWFVQWIVEVTSSDDDGGAPRDDKADAADGTRAATSAAAAASAQNQTKEQKKQK